MSITRTPSSGHAAPGSKDFSRHAHRHHAAFPSFVFPAKAGEGRDPFPPWAPAFAGVTEFLMAALRYAFSAGGGVTARRAAIGAERMLARSISGIGRASCFSTALASSL